MVCACCDRGQVYCCQGHRELGRSASRRRSNARHQASEEGLLDHAQRNREYRRRKRGVTGRVMGQSADNLHSIVIVAPAENAPVVASTMSAPLRPGDDDEHACKAVGRTDADAGPDHAGLEGYRQGGPAAELERAPAGDSDAARRALAVSERAALRCAVCGRALRFVRLARPARRARVRRAQRFLRGRRRARLSRAERRRKERALYLQGGGDFRDLRQLTWEFAQ